MRHDGKLPRALCCQIVTHCLVVISRQTPALMFTHTHTRTHSKTHTHTHVARHLWLCALITLCEITTVTTAVWATPCFPGHLGHQLPKTATASSLSDTTAHNESLPHCVQTPVKHTSPSIYHLLSSTSSMSSRPPSTIPGCRWVCVCGHMRFIDWREWGTGLTGVPPLGEWMVVERVEGGLPLSVWCVTSAAALSPTNGAIVEPRKESPAEVLFESAWGQRGTAGSVWSTSADVGRMSTGSLTTNDHPQSTQTVGIYYKWFIFKSSLKE